MMQLKRMFLFFFIALLIPVSSWADLDVRVDEKEIRSYLGFSYEYSLFALENGQIKGNGVRLDFSRFLSSDFSMQVFLSSGLGGQQSMTSNYTGLGGYVSYLILGSCCETERMTTVNGLPLIQESRPGSKTLSIGIGLNQYMLYGESSVYPASGFAVNASFQFDLWKLRWMLEAKAASLTIASQKVQNTTATAGILFPF